MTEKTATDRGWAWPLNSKKAHYFEGSRALCMRWIFFGKLTRNQEVGEKPGPDDCKTCHKKLFASQRKSV